MVVLSIFYVFSFLWSLINLVISLRVSMDVIKWFWAWISIRFIFILFSFVSFLISFVCIRCVLFNVIRDWFIMVFVAVKSFCFVCFSVVYVRLRVCSELMISFIIIFFSFLVFVCVSGMLSRFIIYRFFFFLSVRLFVSVSIKILGR